MRNGNLALPSAIALGAVALSLSACGGGGSSPGPMPPTRATATPSATPTPTHTSTPAYTARIVWSGHGASAKDAGSSRAARAIVRPADDGGGATPGPIVLTAPDCTSCTDIFGGGPMQEAAYVALQIAPSPASTAAPSFSASTSDIGLTPYTAPTPSSSGAPTPPPVNVLAAALTPGMKGSFTVTGSDTSPSVTASQTVYVYPRVNIECEPAAAGTATAPNGVSFSNGDVASAASPATADLYISGPDCLGAYASSEAGETLHFPYGGTTYGGSTPADEVAFPDVTTASFSNNESSIFLPGFTGEADFPQGLIFKTASGLIVKFSFNVVAPGDAHNATYLAGPFDEQSFSVDGFN